MEKGLWTHYVPFALPYACVHCSPAGQVLFGIKMQCFPFSQGFKPLLQMTWTVTEISRGKKTGLYFLFLSKCGSLSGRGSFIIIFLRVPHYHISFLCLEGSCLNWSLSGGPQIDDFFPLHLSGVTIRNCAQNLSSIPCDLCFPSFLWSLNKYLLNTNHSLVAQMVKNIPEIQERHWFNPSVGKMPWRREWLPTPYSCLENSMDWGAWWATVHGVTESQTRLRN